MVARDQLLFETENGRVYQCAYFGRLVLTFKEYWMVWDREGFIRFRNQVVRLAICPLGRRFLADRGLRLVGDSAVGESERILVLTGAESEELVWLLDSAHFMLYSSERDRAQQERGGVACAPKVAV